MEPRAFEEAMTLVAAAPAPPRRDFDGLPPFSWSTRATPREARRAEGEDGGEA